LTFNGLTTQIVSHRHKLTLSNLMMWQ